MNTVAVRFAGAPRLTPFGIPVVVHPSWYLALAMITVSIGREFTARHAAWAGWAYVLALAAALSFFACVVAHELGHSLVARRFGVRVRSIHLFVFGGVADIEREPSRPRDELLIAIAGPAVSFVLAAALLGAARQGIPSPIAEPSAWVGRMNLYLGVFNLVPGFPLDGGRILRAALWWTTSDRLRATVRAASVGRVLAYLLVGLGALALVGGRVGDGLWTAFVGWFLLQAANGSVARASLESTLGGITVASVMVTPCPTIDAATTLSAYVARAALDGTSARHVVLEDGRTVGMVSPQDVERFPRADRERAIVRDVMAPWSTVQTVDLDVPVIEALALADAVDGGRIPVTDAAGNVVGLLARDAVLAWMSARGNTPSAPIGAPG